MTQNLCQRAKEGARALAFATGLAALTLTGCGDANPKDRANRATLIRYDGITDNILVEKFYDNDKDGDVEIYVVGPPTIYRGEPFDPTLPDINSNETRAFVTADLMEKFYAEHGKNAEVSVSYGSERAGTIILRGAKGRVMSPEMQKRVDSKYQAISSDLTILENRIPQNKPQPNTN